MLVAESAGFVAETPPPYRAGSPKLLDRVRTALKVRHMSRRTEKAYVAWARRFILFHGTRHPATIGATEVTAFLSALTTQARVSASTQNQALAALIFLYKHVLSMDLPWLDDLVRAKRPARVPTVLSRREVTVVLQHMAGGTPRLMAALLYGCGLRVLECLHLRVKDVDFARDEIVIRQGKGGRDRRVMLPLAVREPLARHLAQVRRLYDQDVATGAGWVELPNALDRKYRNASREWSWQWVFPATRYYVHAESGRRRRHHLHETVLQRAVKEATRRASLAKPAGCHTFRHSFATHILEDGHGGNPIVVRQTRGTTMTDREHHIQELFTAELQFRLASAVRLAVTGKRQPLDIPMEWTHGQHRVRYEEIALRQDQAEYAAAFLQRSVTYLIAVAMKDAIRVVVPDPKSSQDSNVLAAYQIARLIRNAFAHAPFTPTWSIDPDCRDRVFAIPDLIALNTAGLNGTAFDWRHYGGPLALLRLARFVRTAILKDDSGPRKVVPMPTRTILQQGDLILEKVDAIPPDAVRVEANKRPDGGIDLGGGHTLYPGNKDT